jgi:hypothetical protein
MPHCCTIPPLKKMAHIECAPSFYPLRTELTPKPTLHPMPHLAQPGGILRQMCMRYTARRKLALLTMMKHLQDEEGISLTKSAERVQVSASLISRWVKLFSLGNDPIKALLKTKKKSTHPGPLSQLKPLKEALLKYIFEQREQWIEVSFLSIVVVALNLCTECGKKDFVARCSTVKHFVRAQLMVIEWACIFASASRRKLRRRQAITCASFVPSYLALIATGVSSSTWIRCWSIF